MLLPAGYRDACDCARLVLEQGSFSNADDAVKFRSDLMNIARTTLSSKILTGAGRGGEGTTLRSKILTGAGRGGGGAPH